MSQTRTRRKERVEVIYLLTLLSVAVLMSMAHAQSDFAKCLSKGMSQKRHLSIGETKTITLEVSSRITHQLSTHVYRILLEEVLGYTGVKIIENNDYDGYSIIKRFSCYDNDHNNVVDVQPKAMINLEVPVAPDFTAKEVIYFRCAHDMGTINPPGQFGWYIPKEFSQAISENYKSWDRNTNEIHWTHFKNAKWMKSLRPINLNLIEKDMYVEENGKRSYHCNTKECKHGWFIPEWCQGYDCAVLLATDFNNTKDVIKHIKEMKVYVQVAWLGSNIQSIVELYKETYKVSHKGFAILSWSPSQLVLQPQDFIIVQMGRCDSLNQSFPSWGCFYEKKRSGVYAWEKFLVDQSETALELLKSMNFLEPFHYHSLLDKYNEATDKQNYSSIACEWVKENNHTWLMWMPEEKNTILIGGIFPISGSTYTGRGIVKGAIMAIRAVNKRRDILPDYQMELLVADGMCRADKVIKAFIDYLSKSKTLVGVLGPACSETVEPIAGLSKYYKMITTSYSAEGAVFSNRDKYPYFFRTIGENKHYRFVYLELLKQLGWKRVGALTEDGQKYTEYIALLQELLEGNDVTFIANTKFPRKREKDSMSRYLEDLKRKRARIIIADVFDEAARSVMCEAYKLGMTAKQGYVWFLPTWLNSTWYNTTIFNEMNNESINCTVANMIEAINGHFAISYAYYADDDDIMQEGITVAQWRRNYENGSTKEISSYAGYAYDAVWLYAKALDQLVKEDPEAIYNLHNLNVTNKLTHIIKHLNFVGVSGPINFRGGTSRFSKINVMQWYNNENRIVGQFVPNISDTAPEVLGGTLTLNKSAIIWLNGGNRIPDDGTPPPVECTLNSLAKFLNVKCEMAIIILNLFIIFFIITLLSSVIIVIKKRSKKYEKRVMKTEQYMQSLGLQHLLKGNDYIGLDKWEIERECVVLNRKLGQGAFGTVYGGEANLSDEGWTPVAVKTLKMGSSTEQKLDFLSEAEVMKRFDHTNIVKLLGVCTKEEPVYTIMEFMLYGDLKTFLLARRHLVNGSNVNESDEVSPKKLTSMALDVARGLSYLAELKYVHRDVASRNCLLNGQRVVKLGDFGMTRPTFENDYYKFNRRGMLPVRWMAPESLALGVFTPSSDVWSYGVLLYEIITFGSFPFQGMTNNEVLDYVKHGNTITIPQGVKPPLEFLLKTCWSADPKMRPTASELVEYLANNSRLISPCLDVPLASVQMEDTGQLEMQLPDQFRKCSSSFKNLPLLNGISSMSIHTPTRRQISDQADSGISMQMENCCPKEPLLPPRSDSISECSKYATIQHDDVVDPDGNGDYYPGALVNGHAISEV